MKKLLKLFVIASVLTFAGIFSFKNETYPLIAEPEETSEPIEVSSEEPIEISSSEPEEVVSSEEEPEEVSSNPEIVSSEPEIVEEPVEEENETIKNKIEVFRDTFLVPLLSGVSVTTIISLAVSIVFAIKNRRTNTLISQSNDNTQKLAIAAIDKANEVLNKAENLANTIETMINDIEEKTNNLVEGTKEGVKEIAHEVKELKEDAKKMFEMKDCMLLLVQVQSELAKVDPNAVSSGVVEKVAQLNEQAKKLL